MGRRMHPGPVKLRCSLLSAASCIIEPESRGDRRAEINCLKATGLFPAASKWNLTKAALFHFIGLETDARLLEAELPEPVKGCSGGCRWGQTWRAMEGMQEGGGGGERVNTQHARL